MSLGSPEIIFLIVAALVFLGPKDLSRIASAAGRWRAKFQSIRREVLSSTSTALAELDKQIATSDTAPSALSPALTADDEVLLSVKRALGNEEELHSMSCADPNAEGEKTTPVA